MSRIELDIPVNSHQMLDGLYKDFERRVDASPKGLCPVDVTRSFVEKCHAESCGKCTPCRVGLGELAGYLKAILDGKAAPETLDAMEKLAVTIMESADCAIGYEAAHTVYKSLTECRAEYEEHIKQGGCTCTYDAPVPCNCMCPAHVHVPGYIALTAKGDYAGAINLIRRDNPFPTACAMVCEHPCEEKCRRKILDAPINIRGIKKFAVDMMAADQVAVPKAAAATGKKIGIIGGGPAGLTAAYFLGLMGHSVEVYESHDKLGGMLRYGIPNYRFPKDRLDEDIRAILSAGDIKVIYNTTVGKDISVKEVRDKYDAVFVGIGAQKGKGLRIPGADAKGVVSAVEILDEIGNGIIPDYTGKEIVVIGGGNVAMDCVRSSIRCGAKRVVCLYRRRQCDMTALQTEVESAIQEGVEIVGLESPVEIKVDADGHCTAVVSQPQIVGAFDKGGRPSPRDAAKPLSEYKADVVMVAIGQQIVSAPFEEFGMPAVKNVFTANADTTVDGMDGVYVGGDCATGPATVIRAVAAGKVAAYNIDAYLGFKHEIPCDVVVPEATENNRCQIGRVEVLERPANDRKKDFEHVEEKLTLEEACQECGRCLRCDHFGCGAQKGGCDKLW